MGAWLCSQRDRRAVGGQTTEWLPNPLFGTLPKFVRVDQLISHLCDHLDIKLRIDLAHGL